MNKTITLTPACCTPTPDPWEALRRFTQARIALGRTGSSLPTDALLSFSLAHAQARDAVHQPLDGEALRRALSAKGIASLAVSSQATSRTEYLRRPDLGRQLATASEAALREAGTSSHRHNELVFVIADGLSSLAVSRHALPFLESALPLLGDWSIGPVVIASQARVALGDPIAGALSARACVVLIGERPGLSSPDSLGIYLTYQPQAGFNDANRNCISNVRPEGLSYRVAAHKLAYLLNGAKALGRSGVDLKDDCDVLVSSSREARLEAVVEGG